MFDFEIDTHYIEKKQLISAIFGLLSVIYTPMQLKLFFDDHMHEKISDKILYQITVNYDYNSDF
jgi:hypothetical protein